MLKSLYIDKPAKHSAPTHFQIYLLVDVGIGVNTHCTLCEIAVDSFESLLRNRFYKAF